MNLKRIVRNRITGFLYGKTIGLFVGLCSPLVRQIVKFPLSRNALNRIYTRLTYSQKSLFQKLFGKVFKNANTRIIPGEWKVVFAGKEILIPLKPERVWLDWLHSLTVVGHEVEVKQTYENLLLGGNKPDLFVDIGANFGIHSLLFLSQGVDVLSFEPNSSCHSYFMELCELNGADPHLEKVALGADEGMVTIKYPEDQTWRGSLVPTVQERMELDFDLIEVKVPQKTLDGYFDQLEGKNVLIKIDTEGNDLDVLRGACDVLEKCKPPVIFESWRDESRRKLYEFFARRNYEIRYLPWTQGERKPENLPAYEEFLNTKQLNFIAVIKSPEARD